MAHIVYLTLRGEKQGLISRGCNTKDSMGNRYRGAHPDQITVLACHHLRSQGSHQQSLTYDTLQIIKLKDKSSPLLATAFAQQEYLDGTIDFYQPNGQGHNERFYCVTLQKVVISEIYASPLYVNPRNGEEIYEVILLKHQGIPWEHMPCLQQYGDFF